MKDVNNANEFVNHKKALSRFATLRDKLVRVILAATSEIDVDFVCTDCSASTCRVSFGFCFHRIEIFY